ncbi:MAG: hypothetical protein E7266_01945 [Lachnospiraceae bacterium]|nr:hypothetical protein [Lachnospiraceae bacterium]
MKKILAFVLTIVMLLGCTSFAFATEEMSDEFKAILNEDGKLELKVIKPESEYGDEVYFALDRLCMEHGGLIFTDVSSDYKTATLELFETMESHTVEIEYVYDESTKEAVAELMADFPDNKDFYVKDMEIINYWLNCAGDEEQKYGLDNFSSELKSYLNFTNFRFSIDDRSGGDDPFLTIRTGIAAVYSGDTIYYTDSDLTVKAEHVIYVSDDTVTDKDSLMAAAQERIDAYAGEGKVEVSYGGQGIYEMFINDYDTTIAQIEADIAEEEAKPAQEQDVLKLMELRNELGNYQNYKTYFIEQYTNEDGEYYYYHKAEGGYWFKAAVGEKEYSFFVVKDSDGMYEPTYKSADFGTDVEISSDDSSIPLDTLVSVDKLTEGDEYEAIISKLGVEENETFDIKLFSNIVNKFITKLENGKFQVKIPVKDALKNKTIIAYYIDENGKVVEYEDIDDDDSTVTFETDHFSIYTLAESAEGSTEETTQTGDAANAAVWCMMMAVAVCGTFYVLSRVKKVNA